MATRNQLKQFEDPYITEKELTAFVNDIVKGIMENDTDASGLINFEEFSVMMRNEH